MSSPPNHHGLSPPLLGSMAKKKTILGWFTMEEARKIYGMLVYEFFYYQFSSPLSTFWLSDGAKKEFRTRLQGYKRIIWITSFFLWSLNWNIEKGSCERQLTRWFADFLTKLDVYYVCTSINSKYDHI